MIRWEEYWKKWIAKNNYQANFLCLSLAAIHRSMNTHWLWTMIKMDLWLFDDIFCCCYIQKEIGCQFNMVSWLVSNFFFSYYIKVFELIDDSDIQSKIQMNPFYNEIHFILPLLNYDWRIYLSFFFLYSGHRSFRCSSWSDNYYTGHNKNTYCFRMLAGRKKNIERVNVLFQL